MTDITIDTIPHREPFRFVDTIVEISDRKIVTTKYLDPALDFFRGHYPDQPVMPAVLQCECCFQAGALLVAHIMGGTDEWNGVPVVTRIKDGRFKRIVRPGDTLRCEVTLDDVLDNCYFLTGRASVAGKLASRVEFACMLAEPQG
jgi:3-hydroxyacyl-[acyl-carrier-protein] dehydratase